MALGPDHALWLALQNGMDANRIEGPAGTILERGNAVFLCLGDMMGEPVKLLGPKRMLMGPVEIEQAGDEDPDGMDP